MLRHLRKLGSLVAAMLCMAGLIRSIDARELPTPEVSEFFANHCVHCHGEDAQEGGLRLDSLKGELRDVTALESWVKVFDKIRTGQMPPDDEPQPSDAERAALVASLQKSLHAASLAMQAKNGRVVMRRLNRTEYENTLADLLGLRVAVREMLPEDQSAEGFDNVATALNVSPAHMARYLQASSEALNLALTRRRNQVVADRRLGGRWASEQRKSALGKDYLVDGDAAILFSSYRHGFQSAQAMLSGRYRLRFAAAAVNTDKPLTVSVRWFSGNSRDGEALARFAVLPGKTQEFAFEGDIDARGSASLIAISLPSQQELKAQLGERSLAEAQLPGVRLEWLEFDGPQGRAWPPESHRAMFGDLAEFYPTSAIDNLKRGRPLGDLAKTPVERNWVAYSLQPKDDAVRVIEHFARRAFRRPVESDELTAFVEMAHQRLAAGYEFHEALKVAFQAILCDPRFLYLIESPGKLDDYAVATRLSYFLWSTMPDDELVASAAAGKLREPAELRAQTERLLRDPRAVAFRENFLGQWMDLRKIRDTFPEQSLYPDYDDELHWSMEQETRLFFDEVLRENLSLLNFIASDFLMVNERLALHYGIADVEGKFMRKIANPPQSHRGGLLAQAAVMKVSADGTLTSPIVRGKFVLERILGTPPSPPPSNIVAIEPDIRGATTIREQLAKHKTDANCASCHRHLDPPGFALESFDVIGGYRTFYRVSTDRKLGRQSLPTGGKVWIGPQVEVGDVTPEGQRFANFDEYQQLLLSQKNQITRSLAEKLLTYATGGGMQFADRQAVDEIVACVAADDYRFRELVHQVVQSRVFRSK